MTTFKREIKFDDDIMKVISINVAKYRRQKHITQEQLALDTDIAYDFYRHFESGKGVIGISIENLYKISIVLEVDVGCFFKKE